MDNVKILDCTIRDGGYYNNWDFSTNFAKNYLKTLSKTSVEIIEIGFRKPIDNIGSGPSGLKKIGKFLISEEKYLSQFKFDKDKKISVMIDLSDYIKKDGFEKLKKNFYNSNKSLIKIVRIACNFNDRKHLNKIVKHLKNNNYIVCVNLMKFTILSNQEILSFFKLGLKIGADYLYLADSFGNCTPNKIMNVSKFIKNRGIKLNCLGFHSHDNTGNALKNTIASIKAGFGIIDTSIMGMGRGAGNLRLENFLKYQKKYKELNKVNLFSKKFMKNLLNKYKWGKNKYYIYSAQNNIHPTFIQRFLEEEKFKKDKMLKTLKFLKKNNATQYDMNIFDNLFLDVKKFKKTQNKDNSKIAILCDNSQTKSINLRKLKTKGYYTSTLNFVKFVNNKKLDYIFMCNAYRTFTEIERVLSIKSIKLIIPNYQILKNILKKNNNKIINYNIKKNQNFRIKKDQCENDKNLVLVYALSYCIAQKFKEIKIFGLTKNISNFGILDKMKKYIKRKNFNSKIVLQ
tara:strand:- start:2006 stop:3544 length:1539 start_codon:yes stop_codon:yes gene_type:complete